MNFQITLPRIIAATILGMAGVLTGGLLIGASRAAGNDPMAEAIAGSRIAIPGPESNYQAAILADGKVDESEFLRARDAFFGCMESAGITVLRPGDSRLAGAPSGYGLEIKGDPDDRARSEALAAVGEASVESCRATYYSHVEFAYVYGNPRPESEVAAEKQRLAACLRDKGYAVADSLPQADLQPLLSAPAGSAAAETFRGCARAMSSS